MAAVTGFSGKVVIVAGAVSRTGAALVRGLSEQGAMVVALDDDPAGLMRLSATLPQAIEPLVLSPYRSDSLRLFAASWGDEAISALVLAQPMAQAESGALRAVVTMARGMGQALRAGGGSALVVYPDAGDGAVSVAQAAAMAALIAALAGEAGVPVNALAVGPEALAAPDMLVGPATYLISDTRISGAVVPVGRANPGAGPNRTAERAVAAGKAARQD